MTTLAALTRDPPGIVEAYASNELVHFGLHALWIVAAAVFWLPVLGRPPVYEPLSYPARIAYLIAATIVPTIPASFLTWDKRSVVRVPLLVAALANFRTKT